jgi:hypothetical protein
VSTPGGEQPAPPAGQSPASPWITRWQTVLVAGVTALGAVAVALVTAFGGSSSAQPKASGAVAEVDSAPLGSAPSIEVEDLDRQRAQLNAEIRRTRFDSSTEGTRTIIVSGVVNGFRDAIAAGLSIPIYRVVAEPVDSPQLDSTLGLPSVVYFSDLVQIQPDGSWEAKILIPVEDRRDVDVYMAACSWRAAHELNARGPGSVPVDMLWEGGPDPKIYIDQPISPRLKVSPSDG